MFVRLHFNAGDERMNERGTHAMATHDITTHKTVCAHDCPDACSVLVDVSNGRPTRFRGDPEHPITRGFLCGKVGAYEEVTNSSERVHYPLQRVGPQGSAQFERVSWEFALETIAALLKEVGGLGSSSEGDGESILLYYYAGTMGYVQRFCADALFHRLGATRLRQNICYYGADAGYSAVVGDGFGVDIEDVVHSDLITVWGANIVTTQVHLVPFVDEARKNGAEVWVVDPYRNRTVRKADEWLQVRPGTDTALALGLIHVLERDDKVDRQFIEERTVGFEQLSETILPVYDPQTAAEITGICL